MDFRMNPKKEYNLYSNQKPPPNCRRKKSWPQTRWKPAVNLAKENKQT
jgi:hypothetical protein